MEPESALPLDLLKLARPVAVDLDALVREHKQMVYRIAFSVLRNHHDAEDAAQEAFLKVFRSARKLAGVADPKAWIARITWNAALDRRRSVAADVEPLAQGVRELLDRGRTAEEIAAGSEMGRLLEQFIRTLPPKLREALILSTVEELEHAQLAAALGINEAAVRSRLHQARKLLKEKLDRVLGVNP